MATTRGSAALYARALFSFTRAGHEWVARCVMTFIGIALASAAAAAPPPVPDILHYKFDGSGTTVTNYAVGAPATLAPATGTIVGGQTQGATVTSTAYKGLLGTGGSSSVDYVNTGWATNLADSFTISFVSSNVPSSSTLFYIFGDNTAGSLRIFTNGVAGATNWILRGGLTDTLIGGGAVTATTVNTFVYDKVAGEIRAYLNGTLVNTVLQSTVTVTGTGPLKIGGYASNTGVALGANLADFRIYNRALTAQEVQDISTAVFLTPQTLTFGAAPSVAVNGTGNVSATSASPNSGNPITFSTTSTDCSVTAAGAVTGINAGTNNCTITANQAGDATYADGTATQTFSISKANQTLTFGAQSPPSRLFASGATFSINPLATSATPNSGNAIAYSSTDTAVCTVSGTTVTMVAVGTCPIAADQTGNANYNDATRVTQNVVLDAGVTIGGTVSGLAGSGLVLSLNAGAQTRSVSASGAFSFPSSLTTGSSYTVTVQTQPSAPTQTCTVSAGSGTANANVTNVAVSCATNTYSIGGTVSGLAGSGLVLSLNSGAQTLNVAANGAFTFPSAIADGAAYAVSVQTQPSAPTQTCAVANGSGNVASANVSNVAVTCTTNAYSIGGTVTGLTGTGLVLSLNGGAQTLAVSSNGTFTFPTPINSGATYTVIVQTQPSSPSQSCAVASGSGTVTNSNITNVALTCAANTFTVGGSVSGLGGAGLVLSLNAGAQTVAVSASGSFVFPSALAQGSSYTITVQAQPSGQQCSVQNGAGTVGTANVVNVVVACAVVANTQPVPTLSAALAFVMSCLLVAAAALRLRRRGV